jgi:hypothetical protein
VTPAHKARGVTWNEVVALVADLADTVVSTSYGTPAIKVKGATGAIARLREDGETMVLRAAFVVRDHLLQAEPDVFFLEEHYRDYPAVLVRLPEATAEQLRELLEDAWRASSARTPPSRAPAPSPPSGRAPRGA